MRFPSLPLTLILLLDAAVSCLNASDEPARREWTIDGVPREALVYVPPNATTGPTPVIFAFHGHGGTMAGAAKSFSYHTQWPEALVVYMQGLNTPGLITDHEGKKPGWQALPGSQNDRDLKFFDAVLASLDQDYKVDEKRIYVTGHSNGGLFTYLLWAERGDRLAAVAPSAAIAGPGVSVLLKPKPALLVSGAADKTVKFEWQQQMMDTIRKLNQCGDGQPWEGRKDCTLYPSQVNAPLVTFIHPGGHVIPPESPALIVQFFKEHTKE